MLEDFLWNFLKACNCSSFPVFLSVTAGQATQGLPLVHIWPIRDNEFKTKVACYPLLALLTHVFLHYLMFRTRNITKRVVKRQKLT